MRQAFFILLLFVTVSEIKAQTFVVDSLGDIICKVEDPQIDSLDDVVTFCEQMPAYDGGGEAMMGFINKNLIYPIEARKNRVEGRIVLQFVVNRDGSLSNIEVLKGLGFGCDEEAVRVVMLMPKWVPGRQNGKVVRVRYTLPMVFRLK